MHKDLWGKVFKKEEVTHDPEYAKWREDLLLLEKKSEELKTLIDDLENQIEDANDEPLLVERAMRIEELESQLENAREELLSIEREIYLKEKRPE